MARQNSTNTGIDFSVSAIASGASVSIDLVSARAFTLTLNQNTTISAIPNFPSWASHLIFYLQITQDSSGGRTLSFPGSVVLEGSINTLPNSISIIKFLTFNSGTNWHALVEKPISSSSALWTPAATTTYLWFDPSDSATIYYSGGTSVSQLNDKSGGSRHITQSTASEQPTLIANTLNNYPIISFDGGDTLNNTGVNVSNIKFVILIFKQTTSSFWDSGLIGGDLIVTTSGAVLCLRKKNDGSIIIDSSVSSSADFNIVAYKMATNDAAFYINAASIGTDTSYNSFSTGTFSLGGGGGIKLIGQIAEFVAFDNVPSSDVILKIEGYLAYKWGLVSKLPSNHLYKNAPPTL